MSRTRLTSWLFAADRTGPQLPERVRQQAAAAVELSRLAEGAAQQASSLRVPGVRALRVAQRYVRCAERDLSRDLPASCRRHALLCSAMHEDGTNGTPRVPHECRNHAEAVILVCWSISYTQLVVCYTFIGHAGGTTSTSPIQSFAGGPVSDLRARIFGTTRLNEAPGRNINLLLWFGISLRETCARDLSFVQVSRSGILWDPVTF